MRASWSDLSLQSHVVADAAAQSHAVHKVVAGTRGEERSMVVYLGLVFISPSLGVTNTNTCRSSSSRLVGLFTRLVGVAEPPPPPLVIIVGLA